MCMGLHIHFSLACMIVWWYCSERHCQTSHDYALVVEVPRGADNVSFVSTAEALVLHGLLATKTKWDSLHGAGSLQMLRSKCFCLMMKPMLHTLRIRSYQVCLLWCATHLADFSEGCRQWWHAARASIFVLLHHNLSAIWQTSTNDENNHIIFRVWLPGWGST